MRLAPSGLRRLTGHPGFLAISLNYAVTTPVDKPLWGVVEEVFQYVFERLLFFRTAYAMRSHKSGQVLGEGLLVEVVRVEQLPVDPMLQQGQVGGVSSVVAYVELIKVHDNLHWC